MLKIESKYKELFKKNNINNNNDNNNNNDDGEWEEIKKGGKRMKQVNSILNFETSELGTVFQGIIKQDISEKGKSLSNCQIEPFFILGLNVESKTLDGNLKNFFQEKELKTQKNIIKVLLRKFQIF